MSDLASSVDRLSLTRRKLLQAGTAGGGIAALGASRSVASIASAAAAQTPSAATGSVTIAQSVDIMEMNPHVELWTGDSSLHFAIYDSLVQRDDEMNLVPVLAESYENTGENEWTFTLRQGITFHNGEPLTVETIKWNVDDIHRDGAKREITLQNLESVEIVDDTTFKIITTTPDPLVPQRLIRFFILPHQYFEEVGEEGFVENPIGTGAYTFVERQTDSHVTIKANPSYWGTPASIDEATFRIIPDNSTALQALQAGEVDLVTGPPPDQFDLLNSTEGLKALGVLSGRIGVCQFFPESPLGNGELADARVRQAINYAVDVEGIIEFLLAGHSSRIANILPPSTWAFDPELTPYPYDPDRAKELLTEAGFPDGFDLVVQTPSSFLIPKPVEIGQVIQENLGAVGITVDLRPTELATMIEDRAEKRIAPMYFWSWGSDYLDPDPFYRLMVWSESLFSFYSTPQWDELIVEGGATHDSARREEIYRQLQHETFEDPPGLFMYNTEILYAMKDDLQMTPRTDERLIVRNMKWASEA